MFSKHFKNNNLFANSKNMKTKKIGFLLVILSIFLSGGIFAVTEDVSAYRCEYGDDCDSIPVGTPWLCYFKDPGGFGFSGESCSYYTHACSTGKSTSNLDVCLIDVVNNPDCCSGFNCPNCNPLPYSAHKFCTEKICKPLEAGSGKDEPSLDAVGVRCWVSKAIQGTGGPATINVGGADFVEGVWEYWGENGQCIECGANNKEVKVYGDSSDIYFGGNPGNNKFEYVCGADSACDEVASAGNSCANALACESRGDSCSTAAGDTCDANGKCVAPAPATHMACSAAGWCVSVAGAGPDTCSGHSDCVCICSDGTICGNCSAVNLGTYCNASRELETDCSAHDCCPVGTACDAATGLCKTLGCHQVIIKFKNNTTGDHSVYEVGDSISLHGACAIATMNPFDISLSSGGSDGPNPCGVGFFQQVDSIITGTGTLTGTLTVVGGPTCTVSIYVDDPPTPPTTHKECVGLSCVDVAGAGADLCTNDADCAAGPPGPTACDPNAWFFCNPLRGNVETLVEGGERIIGYILGLIGSVALLLIIISGAMYMTSAGSEERIASSKKILTAAVIGLAIALLSYSLLLVIMTVLGM